MSKNTHPTIIIQEIHEPPSLATGKTEIDIHEGERKLLEGIFHEEEGEVSHQNKEKDVATTQDITETLIGEYCATKEQDVYSLDPTTNVVEKQSREIRNTLDMVERVPTDG